MTGLRRPPDLSREIALARARGGPVAGVDEAGRGPLAGPVCAAAAILDLDDAPAGLDDSKRLDARARDILFDAILTRATAVAFAFATPAEIDALDVRKASLLAMARAIRALAVAPAAVLVDGRDRPPGLEIEAFPLIGGDGLSASIAAASIVAKVARDRLMARLDLLHPGYGFARHFGYPTAAHRAALARLGPCAAHRASFAPVRAAAAAAGLIAR
ncbi:MAG: ribonuclease HII [Hyphomicrobiales bacterium]|nr:ribonuclease HII [Hyphomicrobiales bacterium]